jgi:hypothetical protein
MMPGNRSASNTRAGAAAVSLAALLVAPGCFTYSSFQSARIVERGDPIGTIAVSKNDILNEETDDASWIAIEGFLRFGIANRVDGGLALSVFRGVPADWGAGVVTADVRVGVIKDHLAVAVPVCVTIGDFYLASLRTQPGMVATVPLGERAEINGSVRAHVFVRVPDLFAVGYNLGLGLRNETGAWTVRPEIGWMRFVGEPNDGLTYFQFGLGFEYREKADTKKKESGS